MSGAAAGPAAGATTAPQLTLRAVLLSIALAMILAAANTYLGLFAGMTIASAIPAAVVSMAVLRLLGGGGILENNIVATGASAGSSIASGVIFTIPALVILGYWSDFRYSWVLAIAGLGGLLGVLFSVPLRRALIVEQKLAFPEGRAAAEVLRTGEDPAQGLRILGLSALGGGLAKLAAASGLRIIPDTAAAATYAPRNIRVNCVAPGLTATPLTTRITANETAAKASMAMHPLGRLGAPEDVAAMMAFLLLPAAAWITGQTFGVDGGLGTVRSKS